jgi:1,4-alpha-glucan branching enzyme
VTACHRFRKSWGAEPIEGGTLFRLWAPSQERVLLRPSERSQDVTMHYSDDGWFEIETDVVAPGGGGRRHRGE